MDITAKQVTPQELNLLAAIYYQYLGSLGRQIEKARDFAAAHPTYQIRPSVPVWQPFIQQGVLLAQAILGSKDVPPGREKNLELTVRLFMSSSRQPNKTIEWFDKNYARLNFLYDAAIKWPDKTDDSEQKFAVGPFTVHNTMGLAGKDLEGIKDTINKAVMLIKGLKIPGIEKVLYGDVMVVARLSKGTTVAWYYPNEDVVYIRPFANAGFDELHSFVHELGHRYTHKFIDKATWLEWRRYHESLQWKKFDTPLKELHVGDQMPFQIKGIKGTPYIQKIELEPPMTTKLVYFAEDKVVPEPTVKRWIQDAEEKTQRYPTLYSATSPDEHFCDALAHRAMGKLKEPNLSSFKAIIEDGKSGWDAAKLATPIPPGWVTTFGEAGRPNYTSPDGSMRIQDSGRGPERFQILYINGNTFVEDIGWPSLKGALEYLDKKRTIKDHPKHLMTDDKRNWNERMREQNMKHAGTYVQIDRDELEDWMDTLRLHDKAYRAPNKAGIYLLPFSDTVACKLSSTIGTSDDAMGRGMASMQLSLVSRVTGQTLNKKAQGQSHFKRTLNWKKTWAEGIERMRDAYAKSAGFYDALATIEDRDQYKIDVMTAIESIPDWRNNNILADFRSIAEKGGILTLKQLDLLDRTLDRERSRQTPGGQSKSVPEAPKAEDPLLPILRALYAKARAVGNNWLMDFAKSVADQINRGRSPSPKQLEVIEKSRDQFKVGTIRNPEMNRMASNVANKHAFRQELSKFLESFLKRNGFDTSPIYSDDEISSKWVGSLVCKIDFRLDPPLEAYRPSSNQSPKSKMTGYQIKRLGMDISFNDDSPTDGVVSCQVTLFVGSGAKTKFNVQGKINESTLDGIDLESLIRGLGNGHWADDAFKQLRPVGPEFYEWNDRADRILKLEKTQLLIDDTEREDRHGTKKLNDELRRHGLPTMIGISGGTTNSSKTYSKGELHFIWDVDVPKQQQDKILDLLKDRYNWGGQVNAMRWANPQELVYSWVIDTSD